MGTDIERIAVTSSRRSLSQLESLQLQRAGALGSINRPSRDGLQPDYQRGWLLVSVARVAIGNGAHISPSVVAQFDVASALWLVPEQCLLRPRSPRWKRPPSGVGQLFTHADVREASAAAFLQELT